MMNLEVLTQKLMTLKQKDLFMEDKVVINYDCEICKDSQWIINKEENSARPCPCIAINAHKRLLEASGILEKFISKRLDNYSEQNDIQVKSKKMASEYVQDFIDIKRNDSNSIAFLGQVGAGKTHLSIGIANELMNNEVGVCYMQYREVITKLKQVITDFDKYTIEIDKYKNADVLLIDDLYKGATFGRIGEGTSINESDARIIYEIIDHRYLKKVPLIITSEFSIKQLLNLNESINSRIIEMCKGRIIEFVGKEHNFRLWGKAD